MPVPFFVQIFDHAVRIYGLQSRVGRKDPADGRFSSAFGTHDDNLHGDIPFFSGALREFTPGETK